MKWIDDVSRGDWLRERITGEGGFPTVAGTGWDAYARILHPARASADVDGKLVSLMWTWAEAARRRGVDMHPLVEWDAIGKSDGQVQADGFTLSPGQEGLLEPYLLKSLLSILRGATHTPNDITVGVWEGFGAEHVDGHMASLSVSDGEVIHGTRPQLREAESDALTQRIADDAQTRFHTQIGVEGVEASTLDLSDRAYYLTSTTLQDLGDLAEQDEDFESGLQLIWPADHTWLVASEIDFDSTVVAGSADLINRIVEHPGLEAFVVYESDHFDVDARRLT